jgi:hypothetical protein
MYSYIYFTSIFVRNRWDKLLFAPLDQGGLKWGSKNKAVNEVRSRIRHTKVIRDPHERGDRQPVFNILYPRPPSIGHGTKLKYFVPNRKYIFFISYLLVHKNEKITVRIFYLKFRDPILQRSGLETNIKALLSSVLDPNQ